MVKNNDVNYICLFYTHSGAIKFTNIMNAENICYKILPTPRKLSSSCGISVQFCYDKNISSFIINDIEKVFLVNNKSYELVYENE
ncbi:Protein of uncharacterised function (DUF3343) [Clostridium putrefaciens]|uniref:Protein of uncharacterized function (DUF3343) n=1 Tax=Clostridium putrefaciens TaxID=99675 RepID=A0A381JA89_9CLOT|nr:DUF3343 domain-containing protein [Clostridium putrefaciens]SUY47317.1 Protein of uncharacterised function (DUF3343) [Clostridium putrefaciens]